MSRAPWQGFERGLQTVIGTVHSVGDSVPVECRLQQPDGSVITCWLPARKPRVRRGEVISVVFFDGAAASAVLGVVNHTVIDGENYVRLTVGLRPNTWDCILLSAGLAGSVSALGVDALMPLGALAMAYWVFAVLVPMTRRERLARLVDQRIDQEARSQRPAFQPGASALRYQQDGEEQ